MTEPVCPCDGDLPAAPTNLPQLSHIAHRDGTWREFRRAVLTPLDGETMLSRAGMPVWRTQGQGDLAQQVDGPPGGQWAVLFHEVRQVLARCAPAVRRLPIN